MISHRKEALSKRAAEHAPSAAVLSTLKIPFHTLYCSFSILANGGYNILLSPLDLLENLPKAIINE